MSLKRFEVWVRPDEVDQLDWCAKRELSPEKISPGEMDLLIVLIDRALQHLIKSSCDDIGEKELKLLSTPAVQRLKEELGEKDLANIPDWMMAEHLFSKLRGSI